MNAQKKRDPIKEPLLPSAGDSLRRQVNELLWDGATWIVVAAILLAQAAMEWYRWYFGLPLMPKTYTAIAVVALVIAIRKGRNTLAKTDRLLLGRRGEIAVGQRLDDLRANGFRVFHDIVESGYNIDHVIIGPPGVLVIETKTLSMTAGRNKPSQV